MKSNDHFFTKIGDFENDMEIVNNNNQYNQYNQYNPNKVLILNIKELVFLPYYNYDNLLISQRAKNTYYNKIIQ